MQYRLGSLELQLQAELLSLIRRRGLNQDTSYYAERQDLGMFWSFPLLGAGLAGGMVAIFSARDKELGWQDWLIFWGFFVPGVLAAVTGVAVLIRRARPDKNL